MGLFLVHFHINRPLKKCFQLEPNQIARRMTLKTVKSICIAHSILFLYTSHSIMCEQKTSPKVDPNDLIKKKKIMDFYMCLIIEGLIPISFAIS